MKKKKKQAFTLLEIIIAISLIALIGGVIAVNMKGSFDKGKAFKTEQAILKLQDILEMAIATEGEEASKIIDNARKYVQASGIVSNPDNLLKDGWGNLLDIAVKEDTSEVIVTSQALNAYNLKKQKILSSTEEENDKNEK